MTQSLRAGAAHGHQLSSDIALSGVVTLEVLTYHSGANFSRIIIALLCSDVFQHLPCS